MRPDDRNEHALQGQLPQRLARVCVRGERLQRAGWDINTLKLLADDSAWLADACRDLQAVELADALDAVRRSAATLLDPPRLPDAAEVAQMEQVIAQLARLSASAPLPQPALHADATAADDTGFAAFDLVQPSAPAHDEAWHADSFGAAQEMEPAPPDATELHASPDAGEAAADTPDGADALVAQIRHALETSGLSMVFQPILSLRGNGEEQFQALLRLAGNDGHVHTAAEVIPLAARAGLLGAIDRWVLEHCIALIARRTRNSQAPRLFVSQSPHALHDADAPTHLRDLLARHRVGGDSVAVELRMEDAAGALDDAARYARAVKTLGVHVVVSRFETGAVGDQVLEQLPVDFIKLAGRYRDSREISVRDELRELIDGMHERGLRVIAPRVEDARAAAALFSAGVDFIQGDFVQVAGTDLVFDFRQADH